MNRLHFWPLGLILLFSACIQPNQTQERKVLEKIESNKSPVANSSLDPLYTTQAPKLVHFSKVKVLFQPPILSYAQSAKERGIQGDVVVEVWVGTDGVPTKSIAIWGPEELRFNAEKYCRDWRFSPFLHENKPIPFRFRIPTLYRLREGKPFQHAPKEFTN